MAPRPPAFIPTTNKKRSVNCVDMGALKIRGRGKKKTGKDKGGEAC